MKEKYKRFCKYCGEGFNTNQRYAQVCPECRKRNHITKVRRNLFNHKDN